MLTLVLFCTLTWKTAAGYTTTHKFYSVLTTDRDTIPLKPRIDTVPKRNISRDTIGININDTTPRQRVDSFSFKMSKDSLDAPVHYEADDSVVVMVLDKKILLYGKTKTDYKDITLTAPVVEIDQQTQILTAISSKDSLGDIVERARFKQAESDFTSDTIRFNFKTQKGLTKNTFTQSGEFFIKSELSKKVDQNTVYARNGVMTTCNLDDPHFGFHYNRIKVINNKLAVSGVIYPEFEGVPVYFVPLPFGIFPLTHGRHSGLLPPQFTTNEQYGLGLEGLGYYKVLNQYFDVTIRGNIYSYGGWSASLTPSYRRRYKYNGSMNFSMQSTKQNFKGDPDFSKSNTYFINWNHVVDNRARPGTNFSANVSAGSTKFNQYVPNSPQRNFQNQLNSSITYSKSWVDKPYNLTLSANHNQNNALHLINVSLPDAGFSVNTQYPFQKKDFVGSAKWYEKLGIGYNGTFRNQFSFYDTAFSFRRLIDTLQWGAQHSVPVTLSLPSILGGALVISPGINYQQIWIAQKVKRTWNPNTEKTDINVTKGIYFDQQASFSLGLSTAIFGTYQFKKSRIQKIRHVIRPSLSFSYKPDLSKNHFYEVQTDTSGRTLRFSEFEGSLYGFYSEGKFGGASLSIDNNLEMKARSKKDTSNGGMKKIRLIDGYGLQASYNFMADSFQLSPIQFYLRSTLFEKINLTASTVMNPYDYDDKGFPINKLFRHNNKFNWGRFTNGSLSLSTDFKSKPKDPEKEAARKKQLNDILADPNLIDQQNLLDYMRQNPSEFVDFNIPWSVSLGFSLFFSEVLKEDLKGFEKKFSSNLNFNGNFNLSPKWNFGMTGYYDLDTKKLQTFSMNISREMHCWQMSISVTPVGLYRFFSININPKSSVLQDLKINRTRYFSNF